MTVCGMGPSNDATEVRRRHVNNAILLCRYVADENKPIVSATPDFVHHTITNEDKWIILASDGLWDVMPNDRVSDTSVAAKCGGRAQPRKH